MPMPPAPDYLELANVPKPRPPWDWPPMRVPFYWEWGELKKTGEKLKRGERLKELLKRVKADDK